ncbi:hypothetical protein ACH5RR_035367 [Cinchona calisaya]|uniref:Uncharacterized protein n=1 Tax=Cinchona calisaya TaxID=153742 RepID=A0ABD2YFN7_9GENT
MAGRSRRVEKVRSLMGGLRGRTNLASWVVAGTLAYFLWVKPSQQLRKEEEERAALAAASDPYRYVEKRKPIPDPQGDNLMPLLLPAAKGYHLIIVGGMWVSLCIRLDPNISLTLIPMFKCSKTLYDDADMDEACSIMGLSFPL